MTTTRRTLRYQAAASRINADAWTVFDIFTDLPIVVGGIVMDGFWDEQVNELLDELNQKGLETRGKLRPDP